MQPAIEPFTVCHDNVNSVIQAEFAHAQVSWNASAANGSPLIRYEVEVTRAPRCCRSSRSPPAQPGR